MLPAPSACKLHLFAPSSLTCSCAAMSAAAGTCWYLLPSAGVQLVGATDDGKQFDQEDAQLQLDQGQPRCEGGECGRLRSSSMRA